MTQATDQAGGAPDPTAVVGMLRHDLEEIADFLAGHPGLQQTGLAGLYEIVTDESRAPEQALRDVDREYDRVAPIPGGFWDQCVTAPGGGVDRPATQRLDALRDQLARTLQLSRRT